MGAGFSLLSPLGVTQAGQVLECFLIAWREEVPSLHLSFAGMGEAGATALSMALAGTEAIPSWFLGLSVQACWCFWFSSFTRMGHMNQDKTQGHTVVLFSQSQDPEPACLPSTFQNSITFVLYIITMICPCSQQEEYEQLCCSLFEAEAPILRPPYVKS